MKSVDRSLFKHRVQLRVRNFEVDWQGIVHNAVYLHYYEVGRMEYLRDLGVKVDHASVNGTSKVVLVRNEIDYYEPARFDDLLTVYTRVSFIRNTSFGVEGMIERTETGAQISSGIAYHVWLDPSSNTPITVPDEFRTRVGRYEGLHCEIAQPG